LRGTQLTLWRAQAEDWLIDPSELELGEVLGTGGFGEVRRAVWRGTEVAVKTISSGHSNELRNAFLEEVITSSWKRERRCHVADRQFLAR
jgi:serine/threonine protein kinase